MKVVLDTNVLISGFKDDYSYQKKIIDEVIGGRIEAFANDQTIRENRLILEKLIDNNEYKRELDELFTQISWVHNPRRVRVAADRQDAKILESAVVAGADYLITEDRHLLDIRDYEGVKIVEPIEFWKIYEEEIGDDPWQKWINFVKQDGHTKNHKEDK